MAAVSKKGTEASALTASSAYIGRMMYGKDELLLTQIHNYYEIIIVQEGDWDCLINGKRTRLTRGGACLIHPASFLQMTPRGGAGNFRFIRISVLYKYISGRIWESVNSATFPAYGRFDDDGFDAVSQAADVIFNRSDDGYLLPDTVTVTALEFLIITTAEGSGCLNAKPSPVHSAIAYIQSHYADDITLTQLSAYCGYSPGHFSKIFHEVAGVPYREYLMKLRLSIAASMLSFMELPVSDACFRSGFNTLEYFSRAFKKEYGMSPGSVPRGRNMPVTDKSQQ